MYILKISNLFNKLVQSDADLAFYHFGFLDELNTSPENNFNQGAQNGRLYPSLDLLPPENIVFEIDEAERELYRLDLYFSDLYGYDNCGAPDTRTKLEVWARLQSIAKRFIFVLNAATCDALGGGIIGEVRLEPDAGFNDKLCFIRVSLTLQINGECIEVDDDNLPSVAELCDLENYKFCNII